MLVTMQAQNVSTFAGAYFNSSDQAADALPPSGSLALLDDSFAAERAQLEARARKRVRREDAEDLVGQCYLEARKSLCHRSVRDLPSWLASILDNLIRLHFRAERIHREEAYPGSDEAAALPPKSPDQNPHWDAQRLSRILAAVDLTARQYECLQRTLAGETQREIAAGLYISQRAVSYHLQAALAHLRDRQEEDAFLHTGEFFLECAQHAIYRKPHVFDNRSTSEERERRRYQCLHEATRAEADK